MLYNASPTSIGELVVDAALEEIHVRTAKATEHPVEKGGNIADHILPQAVTVQIEGIISNTPMNLLGYQLYKTAANWKAGVSNNLALTAFNQLDALFAARQPIKIVTTLTTYENMVLENLTVRSTASTGEALCFSCCAKTIRLVEGEVIDITKKAVTKKPAVKAEPGVEKRCPG